MNRQQQITAGKVWQIHPDNDPDNILHECGSRSACIRWLKGNKMWHGYQTGSVRIGKVIWEVA